MGAANGRTTHLRSTLAPCLARLLLLLSCTVHTGWPVDTCALQRPPLSEPFRSPACFLELRLQTRLLTYPSPSKCECNARGWQEARVLLAWRGYGGSSERRAAGWEWAEGRSVGLGAGRGRRRERSLQVAGFGAGFLLLCSERA